MTAGQLIALTPLYQSPERNLVRIERTDDIEGTKGNLPFIASGPFKGIIVNKLAQEYEEYPTQYPCSFSVWISSDGGKTLKQEKRCFRFCFYPHVPLADRAASSNRFIRNLFDGTFPKDYATFLKLLLHLMKTDYPQLRAIEVEMKFAVGEEQMPMPSAKLLVNDGEVENISSGLVQEVLERAFPNSVLEDALAENLRCSMDEIRAFLDKLEKSGIVERVPNQPGEWIRKAYTLPQLHSHAQATKAPPKIAIITCLFPEKLCVDTIVQNSSTEHRCSNTGDSNIYTEGEIAGHRIVATKLAMIGTDREAATSAGSITTRLLGKYQQVEHVIIVGVSGGQAHLTDPELHVRLGDVVVSHGGKDESRAELEIGAYMYAYNIESNKKTGEIQFEVRPWSPKHNVLAKSIREIDDPKQFLSAWHSNAASLVRRLNDKHRDQQMDFSRPPPMDDVIMHLTDSGNVLVFPHPNESRTDPLYHLGPIGSMVTFCAKQTQDEEQLPPSSAIGVPLTPLKPRRGMPNGSGIQSPDQQMFDTANENGANGGEKDNTKEDINSDANSIMRINERLREKFRLTYHLRAFDAGFDSVIAAIEGSRVDSWVLVRGVADYQQGTSPQGKAWQNYAAANAVALVETMLHNFNKD